MRATPLQRAWRDESGLTLVELLVVMLVIGCLLAIAVPSYLGFQGRATTTTASANLRAVLPAVEAFYSDNATYDPSSMTLAALRAYDQGIGSGIAVVSGSTVTYCIRSTQGGATVFKNGPGAPLTSLACA